MLKGLVVFIFSDAITKCDYRNQLDCRKQQFFCENKCFKRAVLNGLEKYTFVKTVTGKVHFLTQSIARNMTF